MKPMYSVPSGLDVHNPLTSVGRNIRLVYHHGHSLWFRHQAWQGGVGSSNVPRASNWMTSHIQLCLQVSTKNRDNGQNGWKSPKMRNHENFTMILPPFFPGYLEGRTVGWTDHGHIRRPRLAEAPGFLREAHLTPPMELIKADFSRDFSRISNGIQWDLLGFSEPTCRIVHLWWNLWLFQQLIELVNGVYKQANINIVNCKGHMCHDQVRWDECDMLFHPMPLQSRHNRTSLPMDSWPSI